MKTDDALIDRLVTQVENAGRKIREFEDEHEEVLSELAELKADLEGLQERLKAEVRKKSREGQTLVVVQRPNLFVSVVGIAKPVYYDWSKAKKFWPREVIEKAEPILDSKRIAQLINEKYLDEDLAKKARYLGETPTPRVTIKIP